MDVIKRIVNTSLTIFILINHKHSILCNSELQSSAYSSNVQTNVLWSLAPCQSAFWVPNNSASFNQNWIIYQYEGNPLSKFGECIFTLESDSNTRIEIILPEVRLFGKELMFPPSCLEIYDVKIDGKIESLRKECNAVLQSDDFESFPTFTEANLAVISTTIRYGSFQLKARAVPINFGFPKPNPTSVTKPTGGTTVVTTSANQMPSTLPGTNLLTSVVTVLPLLPDTTLNNTVMESYFDRNNEKNLKQS